MSRSAQQPPTSPSAEAGSDGEEATATAVTATVAEPNSEPNSKPAEAKTEAEAEAEKTAAQGASSEPEAESRPESGPESRSESGAASASQPESESEPEPEPEAESEADPDAAAEAKSRLPALVRTMTATAIDRPQRTGPVGRPGKAVLAGAAIGGALLVSVPFLVLGGDNDKNRSAPTAAETVLGGNSGETPGDFAVTRPDPSASGPAKKDSGKGGKTAQEVPASAAAGGKDKGKGEAGGGGGDAPKKSAGQKAEPKKQSGEKQSDGDKSEPAKGGSAVTLSAPVSLRSHLSGRCIDVPNFDFSDGKKLFVWDCNNADAQRWRFASDGTIRIKDKCLDVADANFSNGSPIQIAWCSGNDAQKFVLNASHDLVNTVVGKCVDIKDNNRDRGAWLQLWSCAGTDNQKWSV